MLGLLLFCNAFACLNWQICELDQLISIFAFNATGQRETRIPRVTRRLCTHRRDSLLIAHHRRSFLLIAPAGTRIERVASDRRLRESQALFVLGSRLLLKSVIAVLHLVDHYTQFTNNKYLAHKNRLLDLLFYRLSFVTHYFTWLFKTFV